MTIFLGFWTLEIAIFWLGANAVVERVAQLQWSVDVVLELLGVTVVAGSSGWARLLRVANWRLAITVDVSWTYDETVTGDCLVDGASNWATVSGLPIKMSIINMMVC